MAIFHKKEHFELSCPEMEILQKVPLTDNGYGIKDDSILELQLRPKRLQ